MLAYCVSQEKKKCILSENMLSIQEISQNRIGISSSQSKQPMTHKPIDTFSEFAKHAICLFGIFNAKILNHNIEYSVHK